VGDVGIGSGRQTAVLGQYVVVSNDTTYGQEENGRWSFYVDVI
jgi:hypothetical protein